MLCWRLRESRLGVDDVAGKRREKQKRAEAGRCRAARRGFVMDYYRVGKKRKKGAGWPMGVLDRAMVKNKSRRKITW